MSLDLSKIVKQVQEMVALFLNNRQEQKKHIDLAIDILQGQSKDIDSLKKKIALSRTTWLVGEPVGTLNTCIPVPNTPDNFEVIATDGSHIDVDRHHGVPCYLINIGSVLLRYGSTSDAVLDSHSTLYTSDADLVIASPDGLREVPVEGNLLGIKRSVEECRWLAEMIKGVPSDEAALGLMDGSLIMWNLEAYPEYVTDSLLLNGFLTHLDEIYHSAQHKPIAVASYISFPRSVDAVNALKIALCPKESVDSDHCLNCTSRECGQISGIYDRDLFDALLRSDERSGLFVSTSKVQGRYGKHLVNFFYLKVDGEIARVEIPRWVAEDAGKLGLAHALIVDQCRRGHGYPVALSEAHEKAVVTTSDRDNFWRMVDESLIGEHLPIVESGKSRSKRTRWI